MGIIDMHGNWLRFELFQDIFESAVFSEGRDLGDRKSTRLNSSHANISYAVFCLMNSACISVASSSRSSHAAFVRASQTVRRAMEVAKYVVFFFNDTVTSKIYTLSPLITFPI